MIRQVHSRYRRGRWRRFLPLIWLVPVVAAGLWLIQQPTLGSRWQPAGQHFTICGQGPSPACVIDGDTIVIGKRHIRMSDYNAPELQGECAAESALAITSRAELLAWINRGPFEMSGGENPPRDKYNRELRELRRVDDQGNIDWLLDTMLRHHEGHSKFGSTFQQRNGGGWCN